MPKEDELGSALENASYLLIKRSGFVNSEHYAKEHSRK
ncbi:MAG: type III-A CRISPR-associated RAMP protein Csm4, partial [Lachnospira sp.]|nr:type III-A CRISPR-associated RAMP protein Csm4 [Lachnospira sp.]